MTDKRVCSDPSCETILSKYNDSDRCSVHKQIDPKLLRVRADADVDMDSELAKLMEGTE